MAEASGFDALRSGLAAMVPRWGLSEGAEVKFLSHSENTTFVASDPSTGARLILRVHRIGYHTPEEIRSELDWIRALIEERVVDTPQPIPDRDGVFLRPMIIDGETRQVAAFAYMTGREPDQTDPLPIWFEKLGALSARLHRHSRRWTRPASFRRKTWDFDAMLGSRPLWGDWRQGIELRAVDRAFLQRVVDTLKDRLARYGETSDRFGLIHADLRLANLLVDGGRLGIIDFDDCGFSWFFYDFASAVSFFEHDPIVPELQHAWLAGYRTVAPVGAEDEAMMPVFLMLRRLLLTAWIASHNETTTAQALGAVYTEGTVALGERFLAEC
jgi:Ser/Thr protein kinase RdoA (MazF antagonist)